MNFLNDLWAFLYPGFLALRHYIFGTIGGAFIPSFFIAGAIATFIPKQVIVRYLAYGVKPLISYSVSLFAGGILSVCACGILPLFQTIYQRGAGLGPSLTFLFTGPAINVVAILFTYQLLGTSMGHARIISVILIGLGTGILFSFLFAKKEKPQLKKELKIARILQTKSYKDKWFVSIMLMIMVFTLPMPQIPGNIKWSLNTILVLLTCFVGVFIMDREESREWVMKSLSVMKLIIPRLLLGIFIIGLIEPHSNRLAIAYLSDGNNSFLACFISSFIGALLYLGTIIGIVAVDGLMKIGMGNGPALALLLSGPTLALPSMIVIVKICGKKIGLSFCFAVIMFSALAGWLYGNFL